MLLIRYVQLPSLLRLQERLSLRKVKNYQLKRKTVSALKKWRSCTVCTNNFKSMKLQKVNLLLLRKKNKLRSRRWLCLKLSQLLKKMTLLSLKLLWMWFQLMSNYLSFPNLNKINPRSKDHLYITSISVLLIEVLALMSRILNTRKLYNSSNRRRYPQEDQLTKSSTANIYHLQWPRIREKKSRKISNKKSRWI